MKEYKYVVLGAGVAGLVTSIELAKRHPGEVLLIEKENVVGGLLRTLERNGFRYDIGSHIIHEEVEEEVLNYINETSGGLLTRNKRIGKLIFRKSYINYPLKSIDFLSGLGFIESIHCSFSLILGRIKKIIPLQLTKSNSNYENDLKNNIGERAYNIFYKPYAVKLWNCDPKMISNTAIKRQSAMVGPLMLIKQLIKSIVQKDNDRYYYYLDGGIGKFPEGLEKEAIKNKVTIIKSIHDFKIENNILKILLEKENVSIKYQHIISTLSLTALLDKLHFNNEELLQFQKIKFRGLKLIFVHVNEEVLVEGECFYIPETKYKLGRISIPKRFSNSMNPDENITGIICEIPCSPLDEIWNLNTKDAVSLCYKDLIEAGLIPKKEYVQSDYDFHINVRDIYPMYSINWKENIKSVLNLLGDKYPNIYVTGKSGFFMQSNMDRSIRLGRLLASELNDEITPKEWYKNIDLFHNMILRD